MDRVRVDKDARPFDRDGPANGRRIAPRVAILRPCSQPLFGNSMVSRSPTRRRCSFAELEPAESEPLLAAASALRDQHYGRRVTFSPKVFLPLTNLCRNHCDYCSFRRSPGQPGEWTMRPDEVEATIAQARQQGCVEALFCLGDKPEGAFSAYRRTLQSFGPSSTVEYLHQAGQVALRHGLLPHTNAGVLSVQDMTLLKSVNVSLGLMLENISPRLCEPGQPHHRAPTSARPVACA